MRAGSIYCHLFSVTVRIAVSTPGRPTIVEANGSTPVTPLRHENVVCDQVLIEKYGVSLHSVETKVSSKEGE